MDDENLITDNLKLINYTIKKMNIYWNTEDEYQDYYDAGLLGLIRGVKKYDPSVGKISTFLVTCIRNAINVEINNKNQSRHKNEYGNDLSLEYEYIEPSGDGVCLKDTLADKNENVEDKVIKKMQYEEVVKRIDYLEKSNERLYMKYRFGIIDGKCYSMPEIGKKFGVSHQFVREVINRAIKRIQDSFRNDRIMNKIKGGNMARNLGNLNDYLFEELERLNNTEIINNDDKLIKEINRSKAISNIATNIINNANVVVEVNKLFNKGDKVPELLGIPKK